MKSYICNFGEHWLTVRKLGNQWFNLNSLLTGPELISDTFLAMFLAQLQQDGYSIFIVNGELAECEADQLLRLCPAVQPIKPQLIHDNAQTKSNKSRSSPPGASNVETDDDVQKALHESKKMVENDDVSLQKALQMSMEGFIEESVCRIETACASGSTDTANTSGTQTVVNPGNKTFTSDKTTGTTISGTTSDCSTNTQTVAPDIDEVRQKRLAFLNRLGDTSGGDSGTNETNVKSTDIKDKIEQKCDDTTVNGTEGSEMNEELSEEEMLKQAIEMSMSQDS
ncbi:Ataxin-3 [Mactra antiquata]